MTKKKPHTVIKPQSLKAGQGKTKDIKISFPDLVKKSNLGGAKPLIEAIEKERGSSLVCLFYNNLPPVPTMLTPAALPPFEKALSHVGEVERLDLFLRCTGGITEVPWRIVSLLREFVTDELGVIVSQIALSGATHIAIAADELVMTPFSVLGSVDPTRKHPLLPKDSKGNPIPTSVEDLKHCIKFIKEQLGESYNYQDLASIISELFKYIDPLAIGALEQSYNLSKLITAKCLRTRKKQLGKEKVDNIVEQLAGGYFSHSFQISRSEVESDLKLPVIKPNEKLSELISSLGDFYLEEFQKNILANPPNPEPFFRIGGVIQLRDKCWAIASVFGKNGQILLDPWIEAV